ncbi:hypothetical protein ACQR10_27795 [Bradyrhizobium sp. HKCCYLRH2060]|uniref:hypothetical protein n=1 Tax=Bradyrhizobium TaxID=374 RepID=UPI002916C2F7|nr:MULTISPECIES: hypothetical protein [unclassified Bradyrhizobium]
MVDRSLFRALLIAGFALLVGLGTRAAEAQQASQPQRPPAAQPPQQVQQQQQPQQPQFPPPPQAQPQQSSQWATMPRMQLERQFAGPLQDTIVQRWRDPADGTVCYIYLPISAPHSPPTPAGFVQYGGNTVGSISCMLAPQAARSAANPRHTGTVSTGQ